MAIAGAYLFHTQPPDACFIPLVVAFEEGEPPQLDLLDGCGGPPSPPQLPLLCLATKDLEIFAAIPFEAREDAAGCKTQEYIENYVVKIFNQLKRF